VMFNITITKDK